MKISMNGERLNDLVYFTTRPKRLKQTSNPSRIRDLPDTSAMCYRQTARSV
jgi:hypothetical protein